jgi:hypothetical protein
LAAACLGDRKTRAGGAPLRAWVCMRTCVIVQV